MKHFLSVSPMWKYNGATRDGKAKARKAKKRPLLEDIAAVTPTKSDSPQTPSSVPDSLQVEMDPVQEGEVPEV